MPASLQTSQIRLTAARYGKSAVRLVKVDRSGATHTLHDLNVEIALEGDFAAAYVDGDNSQLLATDTMRNTVYAFAHSHTLEHVETFAVDLARHFLDHGPTVSGVSIDITHYPWSRITAHGQPHEHAFTRDSGERTVQVHASANDIQIEAGINNLLILKTTNSGWEHFYRDQYTTLPDTHDRILATMLSATWRYNETAHDFNHLWQGVRAQILETFTDHYSPSVQNTLYRMGQAVLQAFPEVERIHFTLPNKHHILFNLQPFGLENTNQIFQVTSDPYGLIEGTVERESA